MLYDVTLRISYKYKAPVYAGRHLLRLAPIDIPGVQKVLSSKLDVSPNPTGRSRFDDFFGNTAVEMVFEDYHSEIEFLQQARIERQSVKLDETLALPFDDLAAALDNTQTLDPRSPLHFLGETPRIRPNATLRDYVLDTLPVDVSLLQAVRLVGAALHRDFTFDARATSVETTHEEAFEHKRGVCQDFSHVMIAALRSAGIPAGYVSGFLRTRPPPGKPRLAGADAMHAWVRAWCGPSLGWVEYDPTNAVDIGTDHIVVGYGRDYSDVSPVKGVLRTASGQVSTQEVDVLPLENAS
ncbi:transglutaminase family protein [Henriciella litoralis]|uniref:transglutaminase family protein n=1 Tax=Henriciella litoralis TaxID=568102 RepID=UPI000A021D8A|nr:transglutaminase family protein [Henriciella litoralis]